MYLTGSVDEMSEAKHTHSIADSAEAGERYGISRCSPKEVARMEMLVPSTARDKMGTICTKNRRRFRW